MNNKLDTITKLFEGNEIRNIWDSEKEDYYFNITDIIKTLTDSIDPSDYWKTLKRRLLKEEQSGIPTIFRKLKFKSQKDGKWYSTDTLDTKGILRLIESIPSKKAEPMKHWLASLESEKIDEVFDPEIAGNRAITYYRNRGYSDSWIKSRLTAILGGHKLTDVWKENRITKNYEYAILTNEIYKEWSGMKASEYKYSKA